MLTCPSSCTYPTTFSGTREPAIYGHATLDDVDRLCRQTAERSAFHLEFRQSNHEGEIVDAVHEAAAKGSGSDYQRGRLYDNVVGLAGCYSIGRSAG